MSRLNNLRFACDGQPFDDIVELAYISRPIVVLKDSKSSRSDGPNTTPAFLFGALQKNQRIGSNIFKPFPQRRNTELVDIQPIIQIEADRRRP